MDMNQTIQFGGLTIDDINRAHQRVQSGAAAYFKPKEGMKYLIRMLPGAPGSAAVATVSNHFMENFHGGKSPISFNCPEKGGVGPCPFCAQATALENSDNPADHQAARDYKPRAQAYCVVIDRAQPDLGPLIWRFPSKVMEQLVALRTDVNLYGKDFTNPFDGDDLYLTVKAAKFREYNITISGNRQPRLAATDQQIAAWLNSAPRLETLIRVPSTAEVTRQIFVAQKVAEGVAVDQANAMADRVLGPSQKSAPSVASQPVVSYGQQPPQHSQPSSPAMQHAQAPQQPQAYTQQPYAQPPVQGYPQQAQPQATQGYQQPYQQPPVQPQYHPQGYTLQQPSSAVQVAYDPNNPTQNHNF